MLSNAISKTFHTNVFTVKQEMKFIVFIDKDKLIMLMLMIQASLK
tara:strand:+ start:373 stop:507 length:135 start_codon:yes stop_codon:yes gene_type:complete